MSPLSDTITLRLVTEKKKTRPCCNIRTYSQCHNNKTRLLLPPEFLLPPQAAPVVHGSRVTPVPLEEVRGQVCCLGISRRPRCGSSTASGASRSTPSWGVVTDDVRCPRALVQQASMMSGAVSEFEEKSALETQKLLLQPVGHVGQQEW